MPRGRSTDGKPRPEQPRCSTILDSGHACSHPQSFHGRALKRCKALGCTCPKWSPPIVAKKTVKKVVATSRK